jgi:hypothetical protein
MLGGLLTKALKVAPKPVQAYDDDNNVDKAEVRKHRNKVDVELLVSLELLYVDPAKTKSGEQKKQRWTRYVRIQARLCRRAGAEKEGINSREITVRVKNGNGKQRHQDDVRI